MADRLKDTIASRVSKNIKGHHFDFADGDRAAPGDLAKNVTAIATLQKRILHA